MLLNDVVSSSGKRDSSRTRLRRRPTILSTCSIITGHASTHAPQVTQSQTASYGMAVSTTGRRCAGHLGAIDGLIHGISGTPASASTAISRMPMIIVLGLSGLPVAQAGQASWQRPHSVHVNPSSRSFQDRSSMVLMPNRASSASRSIFGQLAARLHLAQRGVEERRDDVQVLRARQVDQEEADQRDVRPEEERRSRAPGRLPAGPPQSKGQRVGGERPARRPGRR